MQMDSNDIKVINKHNTLIKGKYDLKTVEYKIYSIILYQMQRGETDRLLSKNEDSVSIKVYPSDFIEVFKNDSQYIKKNRLEKIFEGLRVKKVKYYIFNENTKEFDWSVFGFISKYDFLSSDKSFTLKIDRMIYDMVKDYPEGYTPLNLKLLLSLDGKYTFRFYELLRLWSGTKAIITYTLDEIKEYLSLEDKKSYGTYANLRNKVINPALEELNASKILEIEASEIKKKNKVVAIKFSVKDLETRTYYKDYSLPQNIESVEEGTFKPSFLANQSVESEEVRPENVKTDNTITGEAKVHEEKLLKGDVDTLTIDKYLDMDDLDKPVEKKFKKDFKKYDFSKSYMQDAYDNSVMLVCEKDDVEYVGVAQYSLFRTILINKCLENIKHRTENLKAELERIVYGYYQDLHPLIVEEKSSYTRSELNIATKMENELNHDYKKYNFID